MFYLVLTLFIIMGIVSVAARFMDKSMSNGENMRVPVYLGLSLIGLVASIFLAIGDHSLKAFGFIGVFLNGIILLANAVKQFYLMKKPEALAASGNTADKVFVKKHKGIDYTKFGSSFVFLALAAVTGYMVMSFNYKDPSPKEIVYSEINFDDDIEIEPPPTDQQKKPPPPPPPPIIEEVEDEEEVEEEPEIIETEAEEETEVEIIEDTGEEEEEVEEEVAEPEIFTIVEQQPEFPGGEVALLKYLQKNIKYPPIAKENGIEGTVYISFIVFEDGSIQQVKVARDIGGGCGKEAMRVVKKMPRWKAGKQRGKPVRVRFNIPVKFKLAS